MDKIEEYLRYAAECVAKWRARARLVIVCSSNKWRLPGSSWRNSRRQHLQKLKEAGVLDVADKEGGAKARAVRRLTSSVISFDPVGHFAPLSGEVPPLSGER